MAKQKKLGAATQVGLRQAAINKKNLKGKVPEVAPMIDLGGDQVDIGFNANEIEDPMLMRHLKGVPKQPSIQDIIEEIGDNFEYIELLANATPYGMMVPYALTTPPVDWVFCNGQVCPESPLRDLLIEQGNPFGESGGLPTVPNLSGRTIVGNTGMGNVQQPALDQTATKLNKTLGTTSGLFTIKGDVAPQRPYNIGTEGVDPLLTAWSEGSVANIKNDPDGTDNHTDKALTNSHTNGTGDATANITSSDGGGADVTNSSGTGIKVNTGNAAFSGGLTGSGGSHNHRVKNIGPISTGNLINHSGATVQPGTNDWDPDTQNSDKPGKQPGWPKLVTNWLSQDLYGFNMFQTSPGFFLNSGWTAQEALFHEPQPKIRVDAQAFIKLQTGNNDITTNSEGSHQHTVADTGHDHGITDNGHRHAIVQTDHNHTLPDVEHTHKITQTKHDHVVKATGNIESEDFEFDLTQPGLVTNIIIFHGQHLPEDTEPVVRQDEFAPVAEEVKELKELVASLEARLK